MKAPVMKQSPDSNKLSTNSPERLTTKTFQKNNTIGADSQTQILHAARRKDDQVATILPATMNSSPNSGQPMPKATSSSVDVVPAIRSDLGDVQRQDSSLKSDSSIGDKKSHAIVENVIENIENGQVKEIFSDASVDTKKEVIPAASHTKAILETDDSVERAETGSLPVVNASGGDGGSHRPCEGAAQVTPASSMRKHPSDNLDSKDAHEASNIKNIDHNSSKQNDAGLNDDNTPTAPVINENVHKREDNGGLNLPPITGTPRGSGGQEKKKEEDKKEQHHKKDMEKENERSPPTDKTHTAVAAGSPQHTSGSSSTSVVALPLLPLCTASAHSRWQHPHPSHAAGHVKGKVEGKGRRHSLHHPLQAARRLLASEVSVSEREREGEGEGEEQDQSRQNVAQDQSPARSRRRCKSGTARVVEVVFLKEKEQGQGQEQAEGQGHGRHRSADRLRAE